MRKKLYSLRISLAEIEPEIWRRFVVPADIPLDHLHDIIQIVMGWEDRHLHLFTIAGKQYSEAPEVVDEGEEQEEGRFRLGNLVKAKGAAFEYVYDFGDNWVHNVMIEDTNYIIGARDIAVKLLAGERACPPEDVGSVPGYFEFCAAMKNRKHPEHNDYKEWYGRVFDPERLDVQRIELELSKYIRWVRPRMTQWDI